MKNQKFKLYNGVEQSYEIVLDVDSLEHDNQPKIYDNGENSKIYLVGSKTNQSYDLLFKSKGYFGFNNGTVSVWVKVVINKNENLTSIKTVLLDGFEKQTLMTQLGASFYNGFLIDISDSYNKLFTSDIKANEEDYNKNLVVGATKSANAGCNAVNCVLEFLKTWEK